MVTKPFLCNWGVLAILLLSFGELQAQQIAFSRVESSIDGKSLDVNEREQRRLERFMSRVYPNRSLRRAARKWDKPVLRKATYDVVTQAGKKYLIAAYTSRWDVPYNAIAIYRFEDEGPNQVWLSDAWQAGYYSTDLKSAKQGNRTIVLFKEGSTDASQFGLGGVFWFKEGPPGVYVRDLTPELPRLEANISFPFRPLYGRDIKLIPGTGKTVLLSARDYDYVPESIVDDMSVWSYNSAKARFIKAQDAWDILNSRAAETVRP